MLGAIAALFAATLAQPFIPPGAPPGTPFMLPSPTIDPAAGCITIAERELVRLAIQRFTRLNPDLIHEYPQPRRLPFLPIAGRLGRDITLLNLVDLDPAFVTSSDANCTGLTYDAHTGIDIGLRSFAEQGPVASPEGVPVFAPLDGTVIFAADARPDRNTYCAGDANAVVIDHHDGQRTYFWHLKRSSLRHAVGQPVRAGEQIGLTGSSGCSAWPHLHFETEVLGLTREPTSGACLTTPPIFLAPPPVDMQFRVLDRAVTPASLFAHTPPDAFPRARHIALSDAGVSSWITLFNLRSESTALNQLVRPNGTVAQQSNLQQLDNPTARMPSLHARWPIDALENTPGTWRFRWFINAQLIADIPFEVLTSASPTFNRTPNPVSLILAPRSPAPEDVLICAIESDPTLEDPDHDLVRFEYAWHIDNTLVRRVTSFARTDILPAYSATTGQTVRCVVTPRDPTSLGPAASITSTIRPSCPADANGDGAVTFTDLNAVLSDFSQFSSFPPLAGDLNRDGWVNFVDLNLILSSFSQTCPP